MPRPPTISRSELLAKLSGVFRQYGFDGASMQELSRVSGLSKASLYHHFPGGKEEMAGKVLGEEGVRLQQLVLAPLDVDNPFDALQGSLRGAAEFYGGDVPQCLMNSITLGHGGILFGTSVAAAVNTWRDRLSARYHDMGANSDEAASWAKYAVERIQGALVICRVQADREPLVSCLEELEGDVRFVAEG